MICPHCQKEISTPTALQVEVYKLCYMTGLSQKEAGDILGISQQAVSRILLRLKQLRPELFEHELVVKHNRFADNGRIIEQNMQSYYNGMEGRIDKKW